MRIAGLFALAIFLPAFAHATVIISEIKYDGSATHDWIEIQNSGSSSVDVTTFKFNEANTNHGLKLDRGSSLLPAGGYAVIAEATSTFLADFPGFSGTLFDSSFNLNTTGEQLKLCSSSCALDGSNAEDEITYVPFDPIFEGDSLQLAIGNWEHAAPTPGTVNAGSSGQSSSASSDSETPTTSDDSVAISASSSGSNPAEYLSIPVLRIVASGDRVVSSGADTVFTATVYDGKGNKRDDATISWSFGDGMQKTGGSVYHQYYGSGEYLAIVRATTADGGEARSEITVVVKDASIKISSVSSRGIALTNNDSRTLDLSFWLLSAGGQTFKMPADTQILAGRTILFP
ncbi:MAG: lamin tail domain-containing protein, partial [Minisyncoccia bacterium]